MKGIYIHSAKHMNNDVQSKREEPKLDFRDLFIDSYNHQKHIHLNWCDLKCVRGMHTSMDSCKETSWKIEYLNKIFNESVKSEGILWWIIKPNKLWSLNHQLLTICNIRTIVIHSFNL